MIAWPIIAAAGAWLFANLKSVSLTAAGAWIVANWPEIVKSGDLDGAAVIILMFLLLGYILGARVGKILYWVMAIYMVLKIAW